MEGVSLSGLGKLRLGRGWEKGGQIKKKTGHPVKYEFQINNE
jgi:hypothetical protein